jgi:hypothetical protein
MPKFVVAVLTIALLSPSIQAQNTSSKVAPHSANQSSVPAASMPSNEEIGDLLSKASEYVDTYRQTFASARPSLTKAPTPGFYEKAIELSKQATSVIAAIRKNGPSAYALVGLVAILDDMSLHATRAYAVTMVSTLGESRSDFKSQGMQDIQSLAQAAKNCEDISELLLHATLRLIAVEEQTLRELSGQQQH